MKCFFYVLIFIFTAFAETNAQSMAINTSGATANASSILDISSTSKGVLVPRMTKAQKNAIATPAIGLLVYQAVPDSVGFHYYNGSQWVWLNPSGGAGNDWSVTGNTGTDTAVNFIGTTDNMPLAFRVNNENSGKIEHTLATANTFLGNRSGRFNTGTGNTAFGFRTLAAAGNGVSNTAIGTSALNANTSGGGNVAVGHSALLNNTLGMLNIGIGNYALQSNIIGTENIALGLNTLGANTIGNLNVAIGNNVLAANISGVANTALGGFETLFKNISGQSNVAIGGWQNMYNNTHGNNNVSIGGGLGGSVPGLYSNTTGSYNIAIGGGLYGNTTGSYNIALGGYALYQNGDKSNNIAIGQSALSNNGSDAPLAFQAINNIAIGNAALLNNKKGSNNVALGSSAAYLDTSQFHNVAIGNYAMGESIGDRNVAVGSSALLKNTGNSNVAIGDSAMIAASQSFNTAIGADALKSNTGRSNTAIGYRSLQKNATGNNNVVIGDSAAYNNVNMSHLVAIGSKALYSNTAGIRLTAIGDSALYSNNGGSQNTALGYGALLKNTTGFDNTAVGTSALANSITALGNTALGSLALTSNTAGGNNTGLGVYALLNNINGSNNTAVGSAVLSDNISGQNNTAIGYAVLSDNNSGSQNSAIGNRSLMNRNGSNNSALGYEAGAKITAPLSTFLNNIFVGYRSGYNATGDDNLFIGSLTGENATGSGNIFIGAGVGTASPLSNILAIDNSNNPVPLVYGNFTTDLLRINGTLNINSQYSFPLTDGGTNQVLYTNGAGTVGWANVVAAANNGLNVSGNVVKLGGTLLDSTTITQGANSMVFNMDGTGDFYVRKNTSEDAFMIKNNGFVGLNTADPQYRLHIINTSGGNGPFGRGIVIENSASGQTGEASIAFKNNGPNSVAPNSAWMTGLNNATNFVIAYGDSLKAGNVKMKLDTLGNVSIGNQGAAAQSKLDVSGSFGNAIRTVSVNTTLDTDDHTLIIGNAAPSITVTLPAANTCERREYVIVNRSGLLQTLSVSYFDFSGSATTVTANSAITLQSNGSNWFRIQ
ncbi:MAG: hypothetical protein WAR80_02525 [Ferruginibacter sp.]